jgi:hypothetical protein
MRPMNELDVLHHDSSVHPILLLFATTRANNADIGRITMVPKHANGFGDPRLGQEFHVVSDASEAICAVIAC